MATTITVELSKKSLDEAKKILREFQKRYKEGANNSIRVATEELYNKVIEKCHEAGIEHHTDAIHWEYDESTNAGRVWVDGNDDRGKVIIFNEIGTGVRGSNNPHPAFSWEYDVNHHGEQGWWYPTDENDPNPIKRVDRNGQLRGWTKGLPSRRMFFDAFVEIVYALQDYVDIEMRKALGDLYERRK